jgi:hypothetical protein
VLNDRERRIFEARRLTDKLVTLEDLAVEFGVSRERVRQIEVGAFEKVQKAGQEPRRRDGNAGNPRHGSRGSSGALVDCEESPFTRPQVWRCPEQRLDEAQ